MSRRLCSLGNMQSSSRTDVGRCSITETHYSRIRKAPRLGLRSPSLRWYFVRPAQHVLEIRGGYERFDAPSRKHSLHLGCTPFVRQKVKTHQHRVEKSSCLRLIVLPQSAAVGEAEAASAGEQPARNSQLETHRHDERGAAVTAVAPTPRSAHRIDRFPYA